MLKKRGQAINVNTIIIVILALLVLVILAAAFSGGFGQLWEKIGDILGISGATTKDVAIKACESYCATGSYNALCCEKYKVEGSEKKVECKDLGVLCNNICKRYDCDTGKFKSETETAGT